MLLKHMEKPMDIELVETLQLIIERYQGRTMGSVFIPMRDFPWYNERNGQLTRLQEAGMITKPRFYDNGADITLTQAGRQLFDKPEGRVSLTKDKIYEILVKLRSEMKMPDDCFGYERREANGVIKYRIKNEKPGRTRGREAGKRWVRETVEKMEPGDRGKVEKMEPRERRQRVKTGEGDTMDPVFSRIEYLLSSQEKSQQQLLAARILPLF